MIQYSITLCITELGELIAVALLIHSLISRYSLIAGIRKLVRSGLRKFDSCITGHRNSITLTYGRPFLS